jgi:phytoene desaturase
MSSTTGHKKAAIIGSGVAGMAIAIRLAVKGYHVQVFEANTYPGGKLTEIAIKGLRFDAGPSLFTMPWLVDELFALAGETPSHHFRYTRLAEITHYFYEDGTTLTSKAEPAQFAAELEAKTGEPAENVLRFLKRNAELFDLTAHMFLESSLQEWSTFTTPKAFKTGMQLWKLDVFRTVHGANRGNFKDRRVVQLFDRYATYNGSDPYLAPATLNVISHLEFNTGAYFPQGGMHHITESLMKLGHKLGVRYHFNPPVQQIIVEDNKATGIKVLNKVLPFDVIVSNMDAVNTFRKLLPGIKGPKRALDQPRSNSAIIFYWGINKSFAQLGLHNVFFSANYEEEFQHLSQLKTVCDDPTVYLNITSKLAPGDAPEGMENWFVMINVPPNTGQDWEDLKTKARKNVLNKLSRLLKVDIEPLIVAEDVLDPVLIEQRTSSYQGAIYGGHSNGHFAAFLKPSNFHKHIKGLYFCGGSAHPGGGIPLCLLSARITAQLINKREQP